MFYVFLAVSWYVYRCTVLSFPFYMYVHPESNMDNIINNFAAINNYIIIIPKEKGDRERLGPIYNVQRLCKTLT